MFVSTAQNQVCTEPLADKRMTNRRLAEMNRRNNFFFRRFILSKLRSASISVARCHLLFGLVAPIANLPSVIARAKAYQMYFDLLRIGSNGENYIDALCEFAIYPLKVGKRQNRIYKEARKTPPKSLLFDFDKDGCAKHSTQPSFFLYKALWPTYIPCILFLCSRTWLHSSPKHPFHLHPHILQPEQ